MPEESKGIPMLTPGRYVEVFADPCCRSQPLGLATCEDLVRGPDPEGFETWMVRMLADGCRICWTVHARDLVTAPQFVEAPEGKEGCSHELN